VLSEIQHQNKKVRSLKYRLLASRRKLGKSAKKKDPFIGATKSKGEKPEFASWWTTVDNSSQEKRCETSERQMGGSFLGRSRPPKPRKRLSRVWQDMDHEKGRGEGGEKIETLTRGISQGDSNRNMKTVLQKKIQEVEKPMKSERACGSLTN